MDLFSPRTVCVSFPHHPSFNICNKPPIFNVTFPTIPIDSTTPDTWTSTTDITTTTDTWNSTTPTPEIVDPTPTPPNIGLILLLIIVVIVVLVVIIIIIICLLRRCKDCREKAISTCCCNSLKGTCIYVCCMKIITGSKQVAVVKSENDDELIDQKETNISNGNSSRVMVLGEVTYGNKHEQSRNQRRSSKTTNPSEIDESLLF